MRGLGEGGVVGDVIDGRNGKVGNVGEGEGGGW